MNTVEFIHYLQTLDVHIWSDGDRLRYSAPKDALSPELRAQLVERKAEILALLHDQGRPSPGADAPARPTQRDSVLPLSFAQQSVWLWQQVEPDNPFYNVPMAVRLTGALDLAALERCLNEIVRRHEILRTSFLTANSQPAQSIRPARATTLPVIDLASLPGSQRQSRLKELMSGEAERPFELAESAFRATLLKLSEREYVLLIVAHHLVFDNWSGSVFFNEMQHLYDAFVAGRPSSLPDLPIQYGDVVYWEQSQRTEEALAPSLAYWRKQLGAPLAHLEMPTDWPRPARSTFQGAKQAFRLSRSLTQSLQALSQQSGVTLFMTLLAALNSLLYRYTGQVDIVVGTAVANRDRTQVEGLIGLFADLLVLRADLSGNPAFRELLTHVGKTTLEAFTHQHVPFEKLVQELKPRRDISANPFFQILFQFNNAALPPAQLSGVRLSHLDYEDTMTRYELEFALTHDSNGLFGTLAYRTDLFRAETIRRLLEHFRNLLQFVAGNPDCQIAHIPLLTNAERASLRAWNNTQAEYPRDACVHQLVEVQVTRTPNRVAVAHAGVQMTYGELNRRANRLAWHLRGRGVGPDVLVAIYLERGIAMAVGVLGILKAGGAYVPLDAAYPKERIEAILRRIDAPVLLTQERLQEHVCDPSRQIICLDSDWELIERESEQNPDSGVDPENLAYVMHTSGSTGIPKGVALPHRPLVNLVTWHNEQLSSAMRMLQFASLGFDVSFHEMFAAWASGGAIYIVDDDDRVNIPVLARFFRDHAIEEARLPIVVLQQLAEAFCEHPEYFAALRNVVATGEQLVIHPPTARFFDRLDAAQLHNHYGPSETHLTTSYTLSKPASQWPSLPLIGHPIANVRAYILDRYLQEVPIGVPGELYFGGVCLARGYLNQPDLTAAKFIPDPFTSEPGRRMYASGDLARHTSDGNIEFLGRIDRQVKIRGYRVEPGEVEVLLCQHPAVQEAVVVPYGDTPADKRLVAYVVPKQLGPLDTDQLRRFLEARLPAAVAPSSFFPIDKIPLNANGKVDWRQLPTPEPQAGRSYTAPRNGIEHRLADLWGKLLNVDRPGIDDDFFALGGHSLKAASLVLSINQSLDTNISFRDVFVAPTIRALAALVAAAQRVRFVSIERAMPQEHYPASAAQKRIFILQQIDTESTAYNLFDIFLVEGNLREEQVEATLRALVDRHEALRTSLFLGPSGVCQQVHPTVTFHLDYQEADEAEIEAIARSFFTPFDLNQAPLLRVGLVKLAPHTSVLLFNMHHTIGDGVSLGILIREFVALYEGQELPAPPIQYKDYAVWHNRLLGSAALQAQEEYWSRRFADSVPILNLPTDYPRPQLVSSEGDSVAAVLDRQLTADLKRLASDHGATLYMVLLMGYSLLLSRYANQADLVIGSPVSGRTHADVEGVVGMFVNTLAIRCRPAQHKTIAEYLGEIKTALVEAIEHQDYPFEMLVEKVFHDRDPSRNPLVETTFGLWRREDLWVATKEFTVRQYPFSARAARFDLLVDALEVDQEIHLDVQFRTDLFQRATIERLVDHFRTLLSAILAGPEQRLADLQILTAREQQQIIAEWNDTHVSTASPPVLHAWFEAQVARQPDAIAVVGENTTLTYAALDQRANQLARALQARGIGPEALVGLCLPRTPDLLIGLLAILKTGAAYVPLDPTYPAARQSFILEDSRAQLLIVNDDTRRDLEEAVCPLLNLDTVDAELAGLPGNSPPCYATPANLAYVIYTSGSTGTPKGVAIPHGAVVNFLNSMAQRPSLTAADTLLSVTTISFDIAALELYLPLSVGARVLLVDRETTSDGQRLAELIASERVTMMQATPSTWRLLLETGWQGHPQLTALCGGEAFPRELAQQLVERVGAVWNMYGPTETTIWSTCDRVTAGPGAVPIGRPIDNTQVYILNSRLQPVPVGAVGELYIGGDGLARGYLGRPDLTAERFVPNPFAEQQVTRREQPAARPDDATAYRQSSRLYRTGDVARWLPDGRVEFLGRADHQIKLRGYRIELGEIEAQLLRHPAVREAVVVDVLNRSGEKYLVGYVTLQAPAEPVVVRQFLLDNLPAYMMPGAISVVDAIPLTPNGKINRAALATGEVSASFQRAYRPPQSATEAALARLWQEVLGAPEMSVTDSFFELGGTSLSLLTLHNKINMAFSTNLSVAELFSYHTIEMLASRIDRDAQPAAPQQAADQLEQSIYSILDDLASGQIALGDADEAISRLLS
ncbi:MAG: amino acid adenylation domain-containing protein [Kouleothrix sp.]|nr:amino acid adenylation domain-containing protein [Kouleothrix sp.]